MGDTVNMQKCICGVTAIIVENITGDTNSNLGQSC